MLLISLSSPEKTHTFICTLSTPKPSPLCHYLNIPYFLKSYLVLLEYLQKIHFIFKYWDLAAYFIQIQIWKFNFIHTYFIIFIFLFSLCIFFQPNFPSIILNPGECYNHEVIYKFGTCRNSNWKYWIVRTTNQNNNERKEVKRKAGEAVSKKINKI